MPQTQPGEPIKLVADDKIRRVVMCSGKVYYDLYEEREKRGINDVYLLRVEQLYPWPHKALIQELAALQGRRICLVPGRAHNMGAWTFVQPNIERVLDYLKAKHPRPRYVGRACLGVDRDGTDEQASQGNEAVPRRGARREVMARGVKDGEGNPGSDTRRVGDRSDDREVVQEGRRRGQGR